MAFEFRSQIVFAALFCVHDWRVEWPPGVWVSQHEVEANVCEVNHLYADHEGFWKERIFVPVSREMGVDEPGGYREHVDEEAPNGVECGSVVNNQGLSEVNVV